MPILPTVLPFISNLNLKLFLTKKPDHHFKLLVSKVLSILLLQLNL